MRRGRREPARLRQILPSVLRGMGTRGGSRLSRVRAAWGEVVGPALAERTRVTAVAEGRIRVEVASAALKHDLAVFRREEILEGLRRRLPDLSLRDLSFRVGAVS